MNEGVGCRDDVKQLVASFHDTVQNLFSTVDVKNENVALFVALHALMLDTNFVPKGCTYEERYEKFPDNYETNGIFTVEYFHDHFPDILCQIVAVPMGQFMIVHGTLKDQTICTNQVINLGVQEYVKFKRSTSSHPKAKKIYRDLYELSLKFKDNFIIPFLCNLYEAAGMSPAFILSNLSLELKYHLLSFLTAESLASMSMVNKEFKSLANFGPLWKELYKRDFPDDLPITTDEEHDWKALYKTEYSRRKELKAKERAQSSTQRYRVPLEIDYDIRRRVHNPFLLPDDRDWDMHIGLAPEVQEAFPNLRGRYRVENPILRQMILRNPYCYHTFM